MIIENVYYGTVTGTDIAFDYRKLCLQLNSGRYSVLQSVFQITSVAFQSQQKDCFKTLPSFQIYNSCGKLEHMIPVENIVFASWKQNHSA